ncbi:MAG: histidinol dehydrogenase [archaeon]|nr:histidinol dehydrogenase [archaeon]
MEEKKMRIIAYDELDESFYEYEEMEDIEVVKQILNEVKNNGDKAVKQYSEKFDKIKLKNLEVSKDEIREAYQQVDKTTVEVLERAARNIRFFAKKQMALFRDFETNRDGAVLGQRIIPIEIVGCYAPGGRYPLPSSALMSIIPAKVAGVKEVIVCSPKIAPVTIVAADMAGADRIFNIGGIQAIGAMAYGTETVPKVDKIAGPGNKYVAAAKKEVYGLVGIDFIAGPSEVLIIADETANPVFIALDLLAQAEHDPNAKPNLITTSKKLAEEVNKQLEMQLNGLRTRDVAKSALENGRIILADSLDAAIELSNKIAPEHLELQVKNPKQLMKKLRNYGSLFIGKYSAEVFGDYCSGTNHILPTNRAARYSGGLSVKDFIKILTYQQISQRGADKLAETASKLAEIEGLEAHKKSADIRLA